LLLRVNFSIVFWEFIAERAVTERDHLSVLKGMVNETKISSEEDEWNP
jgi:hypothetical protein